MKREILAEPVLVGREREIEELTRYLNSAAQGKGITVFISGEAGTGKTRLMKEFLNSAKQKQDVSTLAGYCLSNTAVPYFPFFEAFTSYFTTENAEEQEIKSWLMGPTQTGKRETLARALYEESRRGGRG